MDNKIKRYTLLSGSFPFLHSQQGRLAEIYRRWKPIQHFNKDLCFPEPTGLLENPSVIVIENVVTQNFELENYLGRKFPVIEGKQYTFKEGNKIPPSRHKSSEYNESFIKLPWKVRQPDSLDDASTACQCVLLLLSISPESRKIEGLENIRAFKQIKPLSKQVAVIVESGPSCDIEFVKSAVTDTIHKEIPGIFTSNEINEIYSRVYLSSDVDLNQILQDSFLNSVLQYVEIFYKHSLQVFQMFDVLVQDEQETILKKQECRKKYLEIYKQTVRENSDDLKNKLVEFFKGSDILLKHMESVEIGKLIKTVPKEEYYSSVENHLIIRITILIMDFLQSFVEKIYTEFSEHLGTSKTIPIVCSDKLWLPLDKSTILSSSIFSTLKELMTKILRNVMMFFTGGQYMPETSEIVHQVHTNLVASADKASHEIVPTFLEDHIKSIENQNKTVSVEQSSGYTFLLKRLKTDSYKLKLELNSVLKDIAEQTGQNRKKCAKETLRARVHSQEVRQLMTSTEGVKAYGVHYDKMQISVLSNYITHLQSSLKDKLSVLGIDEFELREWKNEPIWKLTCISGGDKVHLENNEEHFGSVGALAQTHDGKSGFISAAHVLPKGAMVLVRKDGSDQSNFVGHCVWSRDKQMSHLFDISLVQLAENCHTVDHKFGKHKHKDGRWFPCEMYLGDFKNLEGKPAFKNGAKTNFTEGTFMRITELNDPLEEGATLEGWIVSSSEEYTEFIEPGDSGAIVYTKELDKINLVSVAQGHDGADAFTSCLKHSIGRYTNSTSKTLHVN